jgi:ElaB/YqjD/DUF883 family membrane-anchored ribosome-binding protein
MKTEGMIQELTDEDMRFDAHEFDGLRESDETQTLLAKADRLAREHPWTCLGLAMLAGFAVGKVISNR